MRNADAQAADTMQNFKARVNGQPVPYGCSTCGEQWSLEHPDRGARYYVNDVWRCAACHEKELSEPATCLCGAAIIGSGPLTNSISAEEQ